MPWFLTRAVGGLPPAPSEGTCPLAPPRPRERGGGVKSDGSRHTLACLGSHWWFRVFCSHERAISSQLRLRCRGSSRVRSVGCHPRHRRASALWHLPTFATRERGGGAKLGSSHGAFGLAWTRTGGFVSFNSTNVRKVANYRARCRDSPRVRSVGRHPRHRRARVLWHLPTLASVVREEPNRRTHGLVWTRAGGPLSFAPAKLRKS